MAETFATLEPARCFFDQGRGHGPGWLDRTFTRSFEFFPDKVSGQIITFEDGSTFRRATDYARMKTALVPGSSQSTRAIIQEPLWIGNVGSFSTQPGGYNADDLYIYGFDILDGYGVPNITKPLPVASGGIRNEAVTKCLLQLADQKVNLGESLATIVQSFRLVQEPATALVNGIRQVYTDKSLRPYLSKSLRDLNREGPLKASARKYLEYVYGWRPLMQDIHDVMQLAKEANKSPLLLNARAKATRASVSNGSYDNFSTKTITAFNGVEIVDRVSCSIWARIDPDYSGSRALNQLGLLNPLSLAWELVPFSFVVDWILPIGGVLNAYTAPAGLKFVDGSIGRRFRAAGGYICENQAFMQSYPLYTLESHVPADGQFYYDGYAREHIRDWPIPGLWFDPDPLRSDRSLKGLALAIANLRSLR